MKKFNRQSLLSTLLAGALAAGCAAPEVLDYSTDGDKNGVGAKSDSSLDATIVDFTFSGELLANTSWRPEAQVESQLLFTIGQLNGENSVGRLDKVQLSDVETEDTGDGIRIRYTASMPVAWGKPNDVPSSYTLILPVDIRQAAQEDFASRYGHTCVDWAAHDVDSETMWYYYRPARSGCDIAEASVHRIEATVAVSPINTTGKYPEYHQVWKDDRLEVVAIFGKFKHGATSNSDGGIESYNRFIKDVRRELGAYEQTLTPTDVPDQPGVDMADVTIEATLEDGRAVRVVALLIDGVQDPGPDFDDRYESLTGTADMIVYAGHSGLGANIRALANKGNWVTGQYAIVFMNGCDTYAYVDSALADAHTAVNDDDPNGTKYLDIVTNAMPAPATRSASNAMALTNALLNDDAPMTYEAIFAKFNRSQVVLVSGEEDNVFFPGMDGGDAPETFAGMDESGTVAKGEELHMTTAVVPAGTYTFEMTGTGDADLYVRIGDAPTSDDYDCRPYLEGSVETCRLELAAPGVLHVMVQGWAASSDWSLQAR